MILLGSGFGCLMIISDRYFHRAVNIKEIEVMPTYHENKRKLILDL